MLSKAVPEGDLDAIQEVYAVTGVGFIARLLHTTQVPAGCAPDAYQSIAASLLGSFAAAPAIAAEPDMLALAEPLLEMLEFVAGSDDGSAGGHAAPSAEGGPRASQTDAAEALAGMAATPEGRACLLRAMADVQLGEFVSRPSTQVAPEAAVAGLRGLSLIVANRKEGGSSSSGSSSKAGDGATPIRCSGDRVGKAIDAMAACFAVREDDGKFEAAELLVALLDHIRGTFALDTPTFKAVSSAAKAEWPNRVAQGLATVLQSKLGPDMREMLLQLAALAVEWHGIGWAAKAIPTKARKAAAAAAAPAAAGSTADPTTLLALLVELCCIELRMALEDRSVVDVLKNGSLITSCYVIFEAAISATVDEDNAATSTLPLEVLERLQQRYSEGLQAVMEFITTVQNDPECSSAVSGFGSGSNGADNGKVAALVDSSIRVLAMWLAEETEAHRDQVNSVLPFVLGRIAASTAAAAENQPPASSTSPAPTSPSELLRLFLPALCHLTAEDSSRGICISSGCVVLVASKLEGAWIPWIVSNDRRSDPALVQSAATACGALLNVLILNGAKAATQPTSVALLHRILTNVGDTTNLSYAKHPVLVANLVVISLRVSLHTVADIAEAEWAAFACGIRPFLEAGLAAATLNAKETKLFEDDLENLWHLAVQSLPDGCKRNPRLLAALKAAGVFDSWKDAAASARNSSARSQDAVDEDGLPHPADAVADSLARLKL